MTEKQTTLYVLNERLKKVKEKFNDLLKSGIDDEILKVYLQSKLKLSRKKVD